MLIRAASRQALLALKFSGGQQDIGLQEMFEKSPRAVFLLECELQRGDELPPGVIQLVKVYLAEKRKISVGDAVDAGSTPCFTITDPTAVWVMGQLYQADLRRVAVGDVAVIHSPVLDGPLTGKVTYIGASIDPGTLTVPVRISTENPGGLLKAGQYLDAAIEPATPEQALLVPAEQAAAAWPAISRPIPSGTTSAPIRRITAGSTSTPKPASWCA